MVILPAYTFYNDLLTLAENHKQWPINEIRKIGGRFSGKTFAGGAFCTKLCNLMRADEDDFVSASCVIYRKTRKDRDDVWYQFNKFLNNTILEQNVTVDNTHFMWKYDNGNEVRFDYTESKSKGKKYGKGKASISGDYIVVLLEEASEFEQNEITAIMESIRGDNPNAQILLIAIANPENPRNWFIADSEKLLHFNKDIMSKTGIQHKVIDQRDELGIPKRMLILYTNWRAIQQYEKIHLANQNFRYIAKQPILVSQDKLDFLVKQYKIDKVNAMVADLGCPGSDLTAVFLRVMDLIRPSTCYAQEVITGGIDPGFGKVKGSGKTGAVFVTYDQTGSFNCHNEYVWDNKLMFKNPDIQAQEIVNFFDFNIQQYCNATGVQVSYQNPVYIQCDFSDKAFIQILNDTAANNGIDYIQFNECIKYELIDRVNILMLLINRGRANISPACQTLLDELSTAMWDVDAAKPKIKGGNDHLIDSLFYALENFLFNGLSPEDKQYLYSRLSQRGKKML